jgi:hypothetical protein
MKELIVIVIGIIIVMILAVFALGVANSSIDVFNITNELERTAGLIAGAIVIDPKIEAFAPKKH